MMRFDALFEYLGRIMPTCAGGKMGILNFFFLGKIFSLKTRLKLSPAGPRSIGVNLMDQQDHMAVLVEAELLRKRLPMKAGRNLCGRCSKR